MQSAKLVSYQSGSGRVLSIYLNVDQSIASNRHRRFEAGFESRLREIEARLEEASELAELRSSVALARQFIATYKPRCRTLALYVQANGNVSSRELHISMPSQIHWQDHPYVQPLQEALDEYEELLVVVIDYQHARLTSNVVGRTIEHLKINCENNEELYFKRVGAAVDAIVQACGMDRIVLVGNHGATTELYFVLPRDLRRRVASFLSLPPNSTARQMEDLLARARTRVEREQESLKVESLLAEPAAHAASGADATLEALNEDRIRELVYADGLSLLGARCETCDSLFADQVICRRCQCALRAVDDMVEAAIERALDNGAGVEQVKGPAAERLRQGAGGIGAFLR